VTRAVPLLGVLVSWLLHSGTSVTRTGTATTPSDRVPENQAGRGSGHAAEQDAWANARERLVKEQIAARGIRDQRVTGALRSVPRHLFVPATERARAYQDSPLPIGDGQTISQPYIVALMTELVRPQPGDRALEVGTGSGYQAAVLSRLVSHVYTIEIIEGLAREARQRLERLGYANVTVRVGDGYAGWPDRAPFDIIMVTAAPNEVPPPLLDQLKPGGRLVIPVGPVFDVQELLLIEKDPSGQTRTRRVAPVAFVPLRRGRS
jgi:protein-L-isoaspartate(D-aspartate) O-methyltransferase